MGSVGLGNNGQLGAFLNRIFPEGLDLGRCQITQALGVYTADPTTQFRAGMLVTRNSSGLVIPSAGTDVLGIAKWNHTTAMYAVATDEVLVLPTGGVDVSLKHGTVSNVRVAQKVLGAGTIYTVNVDYSFSAPNGTVRNLSVGIANNQTVYVSYTYQIAQSDLTTMQGMNFWNTLDEVSQNEGRITVITDAELIFTSQYDTAQLYTLTGATSNLYASITVPGCFTSTNANGDSGAVFVGRVFQVPTATDPFLGLRFMKQPFSV